MDKAITVSQLNRYIKLKIDHDIKLKDIYISGEISNFTNHAKSGHYYFTLKDNESLIKAIMFRQNAEKINFSLNDGLKVVVRGQVSVFERDGTYQIYVTEIKLDGEGDLAQKFELLKEKLKNQGLFNEKHKKQIPKYPEKIGIITAPTGAAIKDIENVFSRRFPCADLYLYPALVQGNGAAKTLINGITYFNNKNNVDVILIGRGGGSAEELWCFNDEELALAVFNSKIPIISCVGHETDFTIIDYVADLRAPTPSAAAELSVPDENSLRYQFDLLFKKIDKILNDKIIYLSKCLDNLKDRESLKNKKYYIKNREEKLVGLMSRPVLNNPQSFLGHNITKLALLKTKLNSSITNIQAKHEVNFAKLCASVDMLSPLKVLSRGYALATKEDRPVTANNLSANDEILVNFYDGSITASVKECKLYE